jgi:hypothetical protein
MTNVGQKSRTQPRADTRLAEGPEGRLYTVPFARVWDELIKIIERRSRWRMKHRDEELGIITVSCRTVVFRFTHDLAIWVSLDEHGLTRVEALSQSRVGSRDLGANMRRITRLMARLDAAVGPEGRVRDRLTPAVRPHAAVPPADDGAPRAR